VESYAGAGREESSAFVHCTYAVILTIPYSHSVAYSAAAHLFHQSLPLDARSRALSVLRAYSTASDISAACCSRCVIRTPLLDVSPRSHLSSWLPHYLNDDNLPAISCYRLTFGVSVRIGLASSFTIKWWHRSRRGDCAIGRGPLQSTYYINLSVVVEIYFNPCI